MRGGSSSDAWAPLKGSGQTQAAQTQRLGDRPGTSQQRPEAIRASSKLAGHPRASGGSREGNLGRRAQVRRDTNPARSHTGRSESLVR